VRAVYRGFLLGTTSDLPKRGYYLAPPKSQADFMVANIRKWNKVLSVSKH
jgi:hypothetical protein